VHVQSWRTTYAGIVAEEYLATLNEAERALHSVRGDNFVEGGFQSIGLETERTRRSFVSDSAVAIDQVEAIGPGRVGGFGGVAEFIEQGRNLDAELSHTGSGNKCPFLFAARTGEDDFVLDVALHLPDVAGMRLGNVNHEKFRLRGVIFVELIEGRNLPPERRSGVAAKNQHYRPMLCLKR
jgi:hypothetical protein